MDISCRFFFRRRKLCSERPFKPTFPIYETSPVSCRSALLNSHENGVHCRPSHRSLLFNVPIPPPTPPGYD